MDINWLAIDIKEWADKAFPDRTDQSMFLKLYGEIAEMIAADDEHVGDEIADVLIMLLDFCKRKGLNPSVVVQRKLAINRQRVWAKTKNGTFQHVKSPCVSDATGTGSDHANASGQALAHDRDHTNPNSCRAHGQCLAPDLAHCSQMPQGVLRATRCFAVCDGPRPPGKLHRGYPDAQQGSDRQSGDRRSGSGGDALPLFDSDTVG